MKISDVNLAFGGRAWITGKPRGDQKTTIIASRELINCLGLVGLSAPDGSHCYS
jgi:hypothetical protein